jgi:hypothetical protein
VKRRLLVAAAGGPRGATLAGANGHDPKRWAATLEAIVVERPQPTAEGPQHLGLDQGDDQPTGPETVATSHDIPPIRRIGEATRDRHGPTTSPARRGVVERTLAWRSTCRGFLVR